MEPREIHIDEVLPKGAPMRTRDEPAIAFLARLLDDQFRLPGTNFRFGLDPIIGLLPGWGDTASALAALFLLWQSAQAGVPKIILGRMALNIFLNDALGTVPVVGDAFSFWFKSNARNYALHQKHAGTSKPVGWGDWLFVFGLLFGVALLSASLIVIGVALIVRLVSFLFGN